ncbi:hypothetical protein [Vibrio phage vB_VmeM-Yong XC32]|nr:hypothetical protein [Vibrio phage vB_VmeM-Yong XC31]QAX96562.1 hypothetical protein [Vibrio phage vB_VmeM-Yong XC32]QAX96880.1 hypothetical protein [Vibrio phage vB_VmeM-Yong MS31]QAX97185.1 hypothetical protein [Vibrio phage vB_VmeM-Yong MS32]
MAKKLWPIEFGPFYTPEQLASMGTFEGRYWESVAKSGKKPIGNMKSWKSFENVVSFSKEERDPKKFNKFGVKSRSDLSDWRSKGWLTKNSPFGHYQWYIHFFFGRREIEHKGKSEDEWQIGRWRSYIARHMGGIKARGGATDKQKQGMLQWYWNYEHSFNEKRIETNAKKMARATKSEICTMDEFLIEYGFKKPPKEKEEVSQESLIVTTNPWEESREEVKIITPETHPSFFY